VLLRQRGAAAALLWLTIPFSVVLYLLRPEPWAANQGSPITHLTLAGLALLVIAGDARRPLSAARMAIALVAAAAVVVTGIQFGVSSYMYSSRVFLQFEPRVMLAGLVLLAVVALVRQKRVWAAAFALSALPWAVLSLLYVVPIAIVLALGGSVVVLVIALGIWRAATAPVSRSS
jgi:hypothetical protein